MKDRPTIRCFKSTTIINDWTTINCFKSTIIVDSWATDPIGNQAIISYNCTRFKEHNSGQAKPNRHT